MCADNNTGKRLMMIVLAIMLCSFDAHADYIDCIQSNHYIVYPKFGIWTLIDDNHIFKLCDDDGSIIIDENDNYVIFINEHIMILGKDLTDSYSAMPMSVQHIVFSNGVILHFRRDPKEYLYDPVTYTYESGVLAVAYGGKIDFYNCCGSLIGNCPEGLFVDRIHGDYAVIARHSKENNYMHDVNEYAIFDYINSEFKTQYFDYISYLSDDYCVAGLYDRSVTYIDGFGNTDICYYRNLVLDMNDFNLVLVEECESIWVVEDRIICKYYQNDHILIKIFDSDGKLIYQTTEYDDVLCLGECIFVHESHDASHASRHSYYIIIDKDGNRVGDYGLVNISINPDNSVLSYNILDGNWYLFQNEYSIAKAKYIVHSICTNEYVTFVDGHFRYVNPPYEVILDINDTYRIDDVA